MYFTERQPAPGSKRERITLQTERQSKAVAVDIVMNALLKESKAITLEKAVVFLENEELVLNVFRVFLARGLDLGDPCT